MKRTLLIASFAAIAALAGCSTAQQANVNQQLANLNQTNLLALQTISNGCKIVQPTLAAAGAASPQLATAAVANGVICATADVAKEAASAVVAAQAAQAAPAAASAPAAVPAASAPAAASAPVVAQ